MTRTDHDLHAYLASRPRYQLQRLQQALNCRVDGKKSRNRDLIDAITRHAAREGLTYEQAKALLESADVSSATTPHARPA